MKYILMFINDDVRWHAMPEADRQTAYANIGAWFGEQTAAGRYVSGAELQPQTTATTVRFKGDKAVVTGRNTGTQHSKLVTVKVAAMHGGTRAWQHETAGWYVLAGADRRFYVDVAKGGCGHGDALVGEVIDEDGHAVTTPLGSCEP